MNINFMYAERKILYVAHDETRVPYSTKLPRGTSRFSLFPRSLSIRSGLGLRHVRIIRIKMADSGVGV